jgi:hypothetical protein
MNRDLAYRLALRLDVLKTEAIDAIRDILEKDNAHRVVLNHNVIIHFVDENTYSETKEVYMTGQCFVMEPFGESEFRELKHISIRPLLSILRLIEEGEYDIEDHIEDKDLSNHIQAQEDAHFDNFCQQNNI